MKYRFLLAALLTTTLDLASKHFANLFLSHSFSILLAPLVSLRLSDNIGIAFSLPITGVFLKIITIGLIVGIVWYYLHTERPKHRTLLDLGYGLIVGGAVGNGIERIFFGQVTDFIAVEHFAILNFADCMITCGVIGIIFHYFYESRHQ